MGPVKLLLDTCTFLWLALDPARLSVTAASLINDTSNELFFSDVSVWEIVLKNRAGKLPLPEGPELWLPPQLSHWHLQSVPISRLALYRTTSLPSVHADPFDRLLAATAIETGFTVLSPDVPLSLLGAARLW
jgi:PIN domain nuclease of toxin-antitoxin system